MEKITIININHKEYRFTQSAYNLLSDYNNFLKNSIREKNRLNDIEIQISVLLDMENESNADKKFVDIETMKEVISVLKENQKIDYQPGKFRQKQKSNKKTYRKRPKKHSSIKRDAENNILGGVCSGISNRLDIDPVFLRLLFVILAIAFRPFIVVYIILWIVFPAEERFIYKQKITKR